MWNILVIIFLAAQISAKEDLKKSSSIFDAHHIPNGIPPVSYNHHLNTITGSGFFRANQPEITYHQQTNPANGERQQIFPLPIHQQIGPNINLTTVQVPSGGYFPLSSPHGGFPHHPGFYPNGGVTYRTDPPHSNNFFHGPHGFQNIFPQKVSTTPATPARSNNIRTKQKTTTTITTTETPPQRSNFRRPQTRKNNPKKSSTLPKRKSRPEKKSQKSRKPVKSEENDEIHTQFNFSYIPEEFLKKGSPIIHPTLEIVRNAQGIPIVVPVFRPMPLSTNGTLTRKEKRKKQRQQQRQNQGQPPSQFFQNHPGFNSYSQGPFTIQLSPFSPPLINSLSNSNGFIPRQQEQQPINITGPSFGLNTGWTSSGPSGPFHHPLPVRHHVLPFPYSHTHFGYGPSSVFFNETATDGEGQSVASEMKKSQQTATAKPTTATKTQDDIENITEEEDEPEDEENNDEDLEEKVKNIMELVRKHNNSVNDDEDDTEEENDDDVNEDEEDKNDDDNKTDEDDKKKKVEKSQPTVEKDEENYVDTEEVDKEIPNEVLKQMILDYNEKNKDTPILQEGEQAQKVADRLRNQIEALLDAFTVRSQNTVPRGRNHTADHIEWNKRLKERYQLKTHSQ